jgi:HB1, ASXL, restriction endonuclease HTH domain
MEVLRRAGRPLSTREITETALRRGLIETHGKTPHATMSARLYEAASRGLIEREYRPGPQRAARGSVRWVFVGERQLPRQ